MIKKIIESIVAFIGGIVITSLVMIAPTNNNYLLPKELNVPKKIETGQEKRRKRRLKNGK